MTCPHCDHAAPHGPMGCTAETGWPERRCDCAVTDVATAVAEWDMAPTAAAGRRAA